MRIGIVGSSGGATFFSVRQAVESIRPGLFSFFVVTDRDCGLARGSAESGIPWVTFPDCDNATFSQRAATYLQEAKVDAAVLFYTRMVTEHLYGSVDTLNIHPALLPAFKGLSPLKRARREGARFFGATLHMVNAEVDSGQIVAQVCQPLATDLAERRMEQCSFLHRCYLLLLLCELMENREITFGGASVNVVLANGLQVSDRANPALRHRDYQEAFGGIQRANGMEGFFLP